MLVALVIAAMLAIAAYEVPAMVRQCEWGELWAYGALWTVGLVVGVLRTAGVELPNPTTLIIEFVPRLTEAIGSLLGL